MRRGGSKAKGSSFERACCKELSLWVSNGKHEDLFWRSAMSGGRATVARQRGKLLTRQAGDICAVAPEGHVLTDQFYVEVKHVKQLDFLQWFTKGTGALAKYWKVARKEARAHGRTPLLILRQNRLPTIVMALRGEIDGVTNKGCIDPHLKYGGIEIWLWSNLLATPFDDG